jgi:hypothetical protein
MPQRAVGIAGLMISRRILKKKKLGEKLDPFPLHIQSNRLIYENVASLTQLFTRINSPYLVIKWN